jgi:hypothetical protein
MDMSVQLHDPTALPSGKEPLVPNGQKARWVPEPIWTQCQREKFLAPVGIQISIIQSQIMLSTLFNIYMNEIIVCWNQIYSNRTETSDDTTLNTLLFAHTRCFCQTQMMIYREHYILYTTLQNSWE